ncbi:uncharacterized protein LOC121375938 [Gigantopelta aegis]|uniref:uncharacterized protein LOC121375938 n=1 Tax=Gigantopelta aegis TaxID=1735272 RepID=UPI001B88D344|nr:uncharacterized protein LOC121375938 [Gigantopelta aegis]
MDKHCKRNPAQLNSNLDDVIERRHNLASPCPVYFDYVGNSQGKLTEIDEEFYDFLQIPSDIEINIEDLETARDNLLELEENDLFPDKRLPSSPDHQLLTTESDESENIDISTCDLQGTAYDDSLSHKEDAISVALDINTSLNTPSKCKACLVDYFADQESSDKRSLTKADNVSCNSNVSKSDTLCKLLPIKRTINPLSISDISYLTVFSDKLDMAIEKNETQINTIKSAIDFTDKTDTAECSTPTNATSVTSVSSCKMLKTPIPLTYMCNGKDSIKVFSNSDTAVSNTYTDGKLLRAPKSELVGNKNGGALHDSSQGQISEEISERICCLSITGNDDVSTSQQNYGHGEGDFVVVDDDNSFYEDGLFDDIVELTEREETDVDQLIELFNSFGKQQENEGNECPNKVSGAAFETLIVSGGSFVEDTSNMYEQHVVKEIGESLNQVSGTNADSVNLPSLEYFAMPSDVFHDSIETDLLNAFEKQVSETRESQNMYEQHVVKEIWESLNNVSGTNADSVNLQSLEYFAMPSDVFHDSIENDLVNAFEKQISETRESQNHLSDAVEDRFNHSTAGYITIPSCSFEQDTFHVHGVMHSNLTKFKCFPREQEKGTLEIEKSQKHVTDTSNSPTLESIHILGDTSVYDSIPTQLNELLASFEQREEKELSQTDKSFTQRQQKETLVSVSPLSQIIGVRPKRVSVDESDTFNSSTTEPVVKPKHVSIDESKKFNSSTVESVTKPKHVSIDESKKFNSSTVEPVPKPKHVSIDESKKFNSSTVESVTKPKHVSIDESDKFNSSTFEPVPKPKHVSIDESKKFNSSTFEPVPKPKHVSINEPDTFNSSTFEPVPKPKHVSINEPDTFNSSTFEPVPKPKHVSIDESNKFNSSKFESVAKSADLLNDSIPIQINEQGRENEPSGITELIMGVSGAAADIFNTSAIESPSILDDSHGENTLSTVHDSILWQMKELLDSLDQDEMAASSESPEQICSSVANTFNSPSPASLSSPCYSFQLDTSIMHDSIYIRSQMDALLKSFEQDDSSVVHNDVPKEGQEDICIAEQMPNSLFENNILSGTCDKPNDRCHKQKSSESDYIQIESIQNDLHMDSISPDLQQTLKQRSFRASSGQLCDSEEPEWSLKIDSDIQKYASMLQQNEPPSQFYLESFLKNSIQRCKSKNAENGNCLSLNAIGEYQNITNTSSSALAVEQPCPKTDSMSLQDFFDMTKKMAVNESSSDLFGGIYERELSNTSIGEFHQLDKSIADISDFEIFETTPQYQQLPFYSFEEKGTRRNLNVSSRQTRQQTTRRTEQDASKHNTQV